MNYKALGTELHPVGDAVHDFFGLDRGLRGFKIEEEIYPHLEFRPTFHLKNAEQQVIAIDVRSEPYSTVLDSVVLYCIRNSFPLKLYIAFPEGVAAATYRSGLNRARENGIGTVEVRAAGCVVQTEALPLSLAGVRPIDRGNFPARYRDRLANAESTFRGGNPVQGCLALYSEVEALSRQLGERTNARGLWQPAAPNIDFALHNWAQVLELMRNRMQFPQMPSVERRLITRLEAVVDYRNQVGHRPRTLEQRIQRDRELKTRFEGATDLLHDLCAACGPLRIHT